MELLKSLKRRSFLSNAIYVGLNVGLAVVILILIRTTGSLLPAFGLALLSKWRVLAVRPRYWFANMQTNLVDFIVSIGFVVFLYNTNTIITDGRGLLVQICLTVLYIAWLLLLKPQSKKKYIVAQAAVALFVGVTALYTISYTWPVSLVVVCMWLIGYVTARHVVTHYDEDHVMFLSLVWGVVLAEIGWLTYHWTIAYPLPFFDNEVSVPQVSFIVVSLGFLVYKAYVSYKKNDGKIAMSDIILPLLFVVSVVAILMIMFNRVSTGII